MDQPAAKKRRLAPKVEAQSSPPHLPPFSHETAQAAQNYQVQEVPPPPPERHEFESFARHLQDAAMLIYRQTQKSPYTDVSVLLLRWEEDNAIEQDLAALEQVLRERYNYRTDRWNIPAVANPSVKLGVRMASFLEHAAPDHLLIVYYTGYGYVGADNQLFWACNASEGAPKLKWNGFRCLFEETHSDMLLLLDTCAAKEPPVLDGNSVKQVIATSTPEQYSRDSSSRSFTSHITEAFAKLSAGKPFTTEHIYHEVAIQKQQELIHTSGLTNGASKSIAIADKLPILYTMTSGRGQNLTLFPLALGGEAQLRSPRLGADGDTQTPRASREDQVIHPSAVADLTFDEPRVLVCTTFVGEASPDMSSFNHWLHNSPAIASKIAVEGMFLGPPTMLLISMPGVVWNVVQHDKVCCFLGYVNSHNMTHLYKRLVGSVSVNKASAKDVEDGRMLLEAREMAASTPIVRRHELPNHPPQYPETPVRPDSVGRLDPMSVSQSSYSNLPYANSTPGPVVSNKNDVEDSAEIQEAAEQLEALSHVRHLSNDNPSPAHAQATIADKAMDIRRDEVSSREVNEPGTDEIQHNHELMTPSRPKQQRRSLQKQAPKQETRCSLCSHAPFKDSSSLRKHIAAAHTRPFPCAFAFAGCTSTFGSKNEWKRHIASQHLCLQYYRCSSCPQTTVEGKGNEFNRKDLFTQHLRRMHAPFAIKKAIAKGDSKLQVDWETHVKDMQQSCLVTRRQPPQRSACPKPDCASIFEGPTSWDEWTEHVGRHMEKGEAARLGVDRLLAKWALDEGIIERKDDGEYRLCNGTGSSTERESASNNAEYQSDGNKRDLERDQERDQERDPEDRTIVAASTMVERMDVDG
ncbi:hypothetical protein F4779DRAFT_579810 [Xylariaceae sp. FL0662B]|nr:hypothetical protein F4779DRAFT_579810 [Xylariaceae sp. FL0662B]